MITQEELAPGILSFYNVFPESKSYIQQMEAQNIYWQKAEVLVDLENQISGKNEKARDTDVIVFDNNATGPFYFFQNAFNLNIDPLLHEYIQKYGVAIKDRENPQLLRYGVGQKFTDHVDDHPMLWIRRLSLSYYINDDYEGGEIEFPKFNLKIQPKAGQLIFFPSNYMYNHSVHEVKSGTRYCVVQWMA